VDLKFELGKAIEILARTPAVLDALLRGLPSEWVRSNEGGESWSPYDIVGHLIHGEETDWIPRARIILEQGESTAFEPFDRFAQFERSEGKTLEDLLARFASLRQENLEVLEGWRLKPADLERRGRHPDFGTVTLEQLLATWVVHDLGHIRQIARVMAKQYGARVGPWRAYIPVLGD
jgi:hypothetical protein